jgi:hypothetical protein
MGLLDRFQPTIYDNGLRPDSQNINDLVDYKRAFQTGGGEQKRIAQAMISQNPVLPRSEIKQNMITHRLPPRFGYKDTPLTIRQILANDLQKDAEISMQEWNNFSGSQGAIESTQRPSGSGIF